MKERLDKFIKMEGLTPSRFAEIMGVQPSSISHLLGGRNKPSYDFIEKMLLRFPKINPDWLILGKGNIYRETPGEFKISDSQTVEISAENPLNDPVMNPNPENNPTHAQDDLFTNPVISTKTDINPEISISNNGNDIEQIIVFFSDKSYKTFHDK